MTSCWYVKDFADGWIKFYDVNMACHEAQETGAVMLYSPDGKEPKIFENNTLKAENERLRDALEWAKPYVARLRDTEIIDKALQGGE